MTRKVLILAMLLATTFFALPTDAAAQRKNRSWDRGSESSRYWQDDNGRRRRRFKGRNRYTYGYRNYGQYRRTQVGNRRYRTVRRYYWNDGVRLSRFVRVYY